MIQIENYKIKNKGALIATFSIKMEKWGNFVIRDCTHWKKNNQEWISFPCRPYDDNGMKKYFSYFLFEDPQTMKAFQEKVLLEISQLSPQQPQNVIEDFFSDVPF